MSPKMWLPTGALAPKSPLVPQRVRDDKTGREMILFLPKAEYTESHDHAQELEGSAKEKAIDMMRSKGKAPERKLSRKEVGNLLRDHQAFLARQRQRSINNRYTAGWRV
jgi:hypothetical protein